MRTIYFGREGNERQVFVLNVDGRFQRRLGRSVCLLKHCKIDSLAKISPHATIHSIVQS